MSSFFPVLTSLTNSLIVIGKIEQHFKQIESTQKYALNLLAKSRPVEGTVISTDFQSDGEGQFGSKWTSEPDKNIAFSLILYPRFLQGESVFNLNMAVAIALKNALQCFVPDEKVFIKWPNDLYIRHKKVAGILIQNQFRGQSCESSVVGIGVNILQNSFPESISSAASLQFFARNSLKPAEIQLCIYHKLSEQYEKLQSYAEKYFNWVIHDYLSHLYLYRQQHTFETAEGQSITGSIEGVDRSGRLLLRHTDSGKVHVYLMKEIKPLALNTP